MVSRSRVVSQISMRLGVDIRQANTFIVSLGAPATQAGAKPDVADSISSYLEFCTTDESRDFCLWRWERASTSCIPTAFAFN